MLPHDSPEHSGARYRFAAWAARLRARGLRVSVGYPNPPGETDALWGTRPRREWLSVLTCLRRTAQALAAPRYDAVVYGRRAFPRFPYGGVAMERLLVAANPRTLLDLDDAIWTEEPDPPGRVGRAMEIVAGVIAGNETIAAFARGRGADVHVVPTCVDPDAVPARDHRPAERPVVGWIGTPGNLAHLDLAAGALARVARDTAFVLRIVCSEPWSRPGIPTEFVAWSAAAEAAAVAGFDVGLMPLRDTEGAAGKCGLKLLQYMAAGVPAIASPVGVNREIVVPGETGFLAADDAEWEAALRRLLADDRLRARLGARARAVARERWSYDAHEAAFLAAIGAAP